MIFFKKTFSYFRHKKPIKILKDTLISLFIFIILSLFLIYHIEINNRKRVYENLYKISKGENIEVSIKKMKHRTLFLKYEIQPCTDCGSDKKNIFEIVFKHKDPNDHPNDYPRIYYDRRTKKVTGVWNGCIGN